jgi:hypothetical protein
MALVSGFFNTQQFGRAMQSVGDDVANVGLEERRLANQRTLLDLSEEKEARLLRLRESLGLGVRGGRRGSRSGGGAGDEDDEYSEDTMAARSGAESVPEFRQTRELFRTGNMPKDVGFPMEQPKEDVGPGESTVSIDQPAARSRIAEGVKGYRAGLVERAFAGKNKDLQESRTEQRGREVTLDAPGMEAARAGGERVALSQGKGGFDIKDGTRLNTFAGDTETAEVGKSGIAKDKAAAAKDYAGAASDKALANQRGRGEDERHPQGTPRHRKRDHADAGDGSQVQRRQPFHDKVRTTRTARRPRNTTARPPD